MVLKSLPLVGVALNTFKRTLYGLLLCRQRLPLTESLHNGGISRAYASFPRKIHRFYAFSCQDPLGRLTVDSTIDAFGDTVSSIPQETRDAYRR